MIRVFILLAVFWSECSLAKEFVANSASSTSSTILDKYSKNFFDGDNINKKDLGGATPLHIAARNGDTAAINDLVAKGATINEVDNENFTPLMRATISKKPDSTEVLVKNGADIWALDKYGKGAIYYATRSNCYECIKRITTSDQASKIRDKSIAREQVMESIDIANSDENKKILKDYLSKIENTSPDYASKNQLADNLDNKISDNEIAGIKAFNTGNVPIDNEIKIVKNVSLASFDDEMFDFVMEISEPASNIAVASVIAKISSDEVIDEEKIEHGDINKTSAIPERKFIPEKNRGMRYALVHLFGGDNNEAGVEASPISDGEELFIEDILFGASFDDKNTPNFHDEDLIEDILFDNALVKTKVKSEDKKRMVYVLSGGIISEEDKGNEEALMEDLLFDTASTKTRMKLTTEPKESELREFEDKKLRGKRIVYVIQPRDNGLELSNDKDISRKPDNTPNFHDENLIEDILFDNALVKTKVKSEDKKRMVYVLSGGDDALELGNDEDISKKVDSGGRTDPIRKTDSGGKSSDVSVHEEDVLMEDLLFDNTLAKTQAKLLTESKKLELKKSELIRSEDKKRMVYVLSGGIISEEDKGNEEALMEDLLFDESMAKISSKAKPSEKQKKCNIY